MGASASTSAARRPRPARPRSTAGAWSAARGWRRQAPLADGRARVEARGTPAARRVDEPAIASASLVVGAVVVVVRPPRRLGRARPSPSRGSSSPSVRAMSVSSPHRLDRRSAETGLSPNGSSARPPRSAPRAPSAAAPCCDRAGPARPLAEGAAGGGAHRDPGEQHEGEGRAPPRARWPPRTRPAPPRAGPPTTAPSQPPAPESAATGGTEARGTAGEVGQAGDREQDQGAPSTARAGSWRGPRRPHEERTPAATSASGQEEAPDAEHRAEPVADPVPDRAERARVEGECGEDARG